MRLSGGTIVAPLKSVVSQRWNVLFVVCYYGHQKQPSSGEGKVSLGAAEVPLHDGIASPHSLHNPWSESI